MILSIGEILVDIYSNNDIEEIHIGGAPFNVASNIFKLNGDIFFYGSIGNDTYGHLIKEYICSINLPNKLDIHIDTATSIAKVSVISGERSFSFIGDNASDYLLDTSILKDISKPNIIHLGSLMLSYEEGREYFNRIVEFAKRNNIKISFDINYREDIYSSKEEAISIYKDIINKVDIIKFSKEEINIFSKEKDYRKALKELLNDNQIAVLTLGKEGSIFYSKDKYISVPSKKINSIDSTGAGDAFYSYFLYALDNGLDISSDIEITKTLEIANAFGALATQKVGAIDVIPTIDEAKEYIKDNGK